MRNIDLRKIGLARTAFTVLVIGWSLGGRPAGADGTDERLLAAIQAPLRTDAYKQRDAARHPYEVLHFFGLQPRMSVVEIWPGGGYWTEILAPYLWADGHYVAAVGEEKSDFAQELRGQQAFGRVRTVDFGSMPSSFGA